MIRRSPSSIVSSVECPRQRRRPVSCAMQSVLRRRIPIVGLRCRSVLHEQLSEGTPLIGESPMRSSWSTVRGDAAVRFTSQVVQRRQGGEASTCLDDTASGRCPMGWRSRSSPRLGQWRQGVAVGVAPRSKTTSLSSTAEVPLGAMPKTAGGGRTVERVVPTPGRAPLKVQPSPRPAAGFAEGGARITPWPDRGRR